MVFAELVEEVYSIEIVKPLGFQAAKVLGEAANKNVRTWIGDGYRGWPEPAPFDAIMVTCAPDDIPQPFIDQLAEGGRMIIPLPGSRSSKTWFCSQLANLKIRTLRCRPVKR